MKKLLLTLGSIGAVVAPVASVVACGADAKVVAPLGQKFLQSLLVTATPSKDAFADANALVAKTKEIGDTLDKLLPKRDDAGEVVNYKPDVAAIKAVKEQAIAVIKPLVSDLSKATKLYSIKINVGGSAQMHKNFRDLFDEFRVLLKLATYEGTDLAKPDHGVPNFAQAGFASAKDYKTANDTINQFVRDMVDSTDASVPCVEMSAIKK